ncbi:MAG: FAD-binding oxidoreductase [Gammaproteobacteria bacterium]|nr:FAD-binding oxidoreductase [Gammaproteobacteria bacterium]TVQ47499.1 MAG: FAD-binding oxidoreductase [Gammaproteobacteria bacterium]
MSASPDPASPSPPDAAERAPFVTDVEVLVERLRRLLGDGAVETGREQREACSADVYGRGVTCAAVIRCGDAGILAEAVRLVTASGCHVVPRGAGLSYTGGYLPVAEHSVIVDLAPMNRILDINPEDMTLTAEAGVTWAQIHQALQPLGLRLPFFGTFSGARATVGGGLSNGALFFGTARYGTAADAVLGLEVLLADGTRLRTGQAGFRQASKGFYRTCGPDLTGLFLHDAGALGVKLQATFRLIEAPAATGFASFAFADRGAAARALSAIARAGLAEDAYVFDPQTTARNMAGTSTRQALATLRSVARGQGGGGGLGERLRGLAAALRMAAVGRRAVPSGAWSLHVVCAGASLAALRADLVRCRRLAGAEGGREIADSVPRAVRASLFPNLNAILGPNGERWAATNAKVAHSDAAAMLAAVDATLEPWQAGMAEHGISTSLVLIAIANHAFSVEPVLHWRDEWLPIHRQTAEPDHLAQLDTPSADPAARAMVGEIRAALVGLFAQHGAASNQLGKLYPYMEALEPATADLVAGLKQLVDPGGAMNPGVLGLPRRP